MSIRSSHRTGARSFLRARSLTTYAHTKSSPYFTNIEPEESTSPTPTASPEESVSPSATPAPSYKAPDDSFELVLREDPTDENDQINGEGHDKHYLLRDLKT